MHQVNPTFKYSYIPGFSFVVALWQTQHLLPCGDISFTVFFLSVTLSMKSTKFGSRYLVDRLSEEDEIWHIGSPGLAVHQCRDW